MRTFLIENFGCRASQADGAALETLLEHRGMLKRTPAANPAELLILNTCTVTATRMRTCARPSRRVHRENPHSRFW